MTKPITPGEARKYWEDRPIAGEVLESVNDLIKENWRPNGVTIYQEDILKRAEAKGLNRQLILAERWLDFEDHYKRAGWKVEYVIPDSDKRYFIFTPHRSS